MIDKDTFGFDPRLTPEEFPNPDDDHITKERFRKLAMSAIESCVAIPDDIWNAALPKVVLTLNTSYAVAVELRNAEEPPDDPYVQSLIDDRDRYEKALKRIADAKNFGSPLQGIAAAALGEVPENTKED
jgi:hypothetical protein